MIWHSVKSLSASSCSSLREIGVVLSAYFDTGNEINLRKYEIVTLAGYTSHIQDWPQLEGPFRAAVREAWNQCDMPDVEPYMHVTDLVSWQEPFTKKRGWTKDK